MRRLFLAFLLLAILGPARAQCDIVAFETWVFDSDPSIVTGPDQTCEFRVEFDVAAGASFSAGGINFTPYTINSAEVFKDGVSIGDQGVDLGASEFISTDFGPDSFAVSLVFDGTGTVFGESGTLETGLNGTYGDLDSFFDDTVRQVALWTFDDGSGGPAEFTGSFESVPEPTATLGFLALGGFFAFKRKKS